ncbi:hypothetical protein HZY62_13840 [Maribacter polysiphoniae]|uniref:DUF541 domain-containing protein n=1 Tax=Maribacter polysiphoniae TaxID=429344 RepID=A0A316DWU2_9FLAO|nr:hypothetical protein [Maribacter polysiphoniae]MBD1261682.1 hypothetical protein [Maribacter polysiphoniae]PWK22514.1 hypothetical protein LX92_02989 [Maribacter polysiphoniae]
MKTPTITVLLLCTCLFACSPLFAQQLPNTINVRARVTYIDPDPTYNAIISLSNTSNYDYDSVSLAELKERFKKSVTESGLLWDSIKEHPGTFGFETMRYNKEGILYLYETKSVEGMKRFLNIKLPILQNLEMSSTVEIDSQEAEKITQMALDKAFKQATLLANKAKKKLGDIVALKEHGGLFDKPYQVSLYYNRPPGEFFYEIEVTYEIH